MEEQASPLLAFVLEYLFPLSLNVLNDKVPHILEITGRLQSALNLWVLIKSRYKFDAIKTYENTTLNNPGGYFSHLL